MKQTAVEWLSQQTLDNWNDIESGARNITEFIEQAKKLEKQQQQGYSDEEVINALHSVELKDNKDYSKIYDGMKEWFEENKNK